jgi:hypothetical protein
MVEVREVADAPDAREVAAALTRLVDDFGTLGAQPCDDATIVDCLHQLERVKSAAAAAQARLAERLDVMRLADNLASGLAEHEAGRGVAHEVALARRESPHDGRRHLSLARALVHDLPETLAALSCGDINERRAEIIARETAVLSREDRGTVDATLAHRLPELGDRALLWATRRLSYELDEQATAKRMAKSRAERRVTSRPLSDGMVLISAVVPAPEGAAVMLALAEYARSERALGDKRTRSQLVADVFCQRLVGTSNAVTSTVNVEVQLVMSAEMLFGDEEAPRVSQPAHLRGHGPVPSGIARDLIATTKGRVLIRRLYANPDDGTLVAMDSRRRMFAGELRQLLINRDDRCRTPWCDAPIRHGDHIQANSEDGATSFENGQGLCESCNYAKQLPGWTHRILRPWPHRHQVDIRTPSGHRHTSAAPPLPVDVPVDGPVGAPADVPA